MLKLDGDKIYLRPLVLSDANENYTSWLNDPVVCKYNSHGDRTYTMQMTLEYINMVTEIQSYEVFAICNKETDNHVGNISLQNISQKNKSAEFAILIGEKDFMGTGIGKEAGQIILQYAFNVLKLHRIYCGTSEYNVAMQKLALHLNMIQEGISIDAMVKNGQYINIYKYAIVGSL